MNYAHCSLVECFQKWGNAASIALFDPACKHFYISSIPGLIGYRVENNCAVVFGDPVCAPHDVPKLLEAFTDFCKQNKKSIVYTMVSENVVNTISAQNACSIIQFGHEMIINPLDDPKSNSGMYGGVLRNKYNQGTKNGMVIKEHVDTDSQRETILTNVGKAWLQARKGPQIHFVHIDLLFSNRSNKRWFYAEQDGVIHAVAMLNRIDAYKGWVQNLLMVSPNAPKYTSEFMLLSILDTFRAEGCPFYSAGHMPAEQLEKIKGMGTFSTWFAQTAYGIAKKIFKLTDRQKFWKKFSPRAEPTFLVLDSSGIRLNKIFGIMKAFNAKL